MDIVRGVAGVVAEEIAASYWLLAASADVTPELIIIKEADALRS